MSRHPRRTFSARFALLALFALPAPFLTGCGYGKAEIFINGGSGTIAVEVDPHAQGGNLSGRPQEGHPYFPLTPGRYADFRIRRFTVDEPTYVRVTFGEPEMFFGRLATPWVYGEIPGRPVDDMLNGLRQYFSIAPDGALWFHGAQNNGFMSHTEPPIRQLPADIKVDVVVIDTVFFESFLPGNEPFFSATQSFQTTITDLTWLDLPARSYRAARAKLLIDDVDLGAPGAVDAARIVEAALYGGGLAPALEARSGAGLDAAIVDRSIRELARGPGEDPTLVPERGMWFARHTGMVARDYPHGQGPEVINITTYERLGEGFGPLPAPSPAP